MSRVRKPSSTLIPSALGVALQALLLDRDAAPHHLVDQLGVLVAEERAHRVEVGVHQRLDERVAAGDRLAGCLGLRHRRHRRLAGPAGAGRIAFRDGLPRRDHRLLRRAARDRVASRTTGPTGCRCPGAAEVSTVATGVSANRAFLEAAVEAGAELAIAHHGLFWDGDPRALSEQMAERLRVAARRPGSRSPPTTCPSTPIARSATTPCSARGSASSRTTSLLGVQGAADRGDRPQRRTGSSRTSCASRVAELVGREPLVFDSRPRAGAVDRHRQRRRRRADRRCGRPRARRLSHRRAGRAGDGRRQRGRHPLHRRRPLRDRDLRGPPPRRAGRRALRRRARSSSTSRTRSRRPRLEAANSAFLVDTSAPSDIHAHSQFITYEEESLWPFT